MAWKLTERGAINEEEAVAEELNDKAEEDSGAAELLAKAADEEPDGAWGPALAGHVDRVSPGHGRR